MRHATLITALAVMACTPAPSSDIIEPAPPAVEDTGDPPEPMDTGGMDTGTLAPALTHLDVIAVVDNSCSMMVEQQRLGAALDAWDPGVSWALHLVTTDDVIGPVDMGDIPAAITGVGIEGNPTEMGIEYAVHYLQQAGPVDDALLVVFLSDEQDSSWKLPTDLAGEMTAAAERPAVLCLVIPPALTRWSQATATWRL